MSVWSTIGSFVKKVLAIPKVSGEGTIRAIGRTLMRGLAGFGASIKQVGSAIEQMGYKYSEPAFTEDLERSRYLGGSKNPFEDIDPYNSPNKSLMVETDLRHGRKFRITAEVTGYRSADDDRFSKEISFYSDDLKTYYEYIQDYDQEYFSFYRKLGYEMESFKFRLVEHQKGFSY